MPPSPSTPSPERGAMARILRAVQFATWQEDVDSPMVDAVIRFNGDDVAAAESELAALEAENSALRARVSADASKERKDHE